MTGTLALRQSEELTLQQMPAPHGGNFTFINLFGTKLSW